MKKNTLHLFITLAMCVVLSTMAFGTSFAQTDSVAHRHPGMMRMMSPKMIDRHLHMMKTKLNLTDAQVDQLKSIMQQHMDKMKADMDAIKNALKGSDARKDARKQMVEDRKAMMNMDDVKSVLTPEQFKKFKAMRLMQIERSEKRLQAQKKNLESK